MRLAATSAALAALAVLIWALPLLLARPRGRGPGESWARLPAAHRGLSGEGAPENSLGAFERAAQAGLAIELDVRACRDGLVVLHDGDTARALGRAGKVLCARVSELQARPLMGTGERVPTLEQALARVAGRVPLVIELKGFRLRGTAKLARAVAGALKGYAGEYCVESFNPLLLRACRRSLPDAPRGLLVASPETMRRMCGIAAGWALSNLLLVPLARPQFVAYEEGGRVSRGLAVWRDRGGACAVWTVRTAAGMERARAAGELAIFEGAEALEAALRLRGGRW